MLENMNYFDIINVNNYLVGLPRTHNPASMLYLLCILF